MKFQETKLAGVFEIDLDFMADERGFFARSWCQREFESVGLNARVVQCNVSFNLAEATLRGLHYQAPPFAEAKLVRCTSGAIYDVAVDLRPDSPSFRQWLGVNLTAANRTMLYIPEGLAHGFLTLQPNTEVFYQMSEFYDPTSARGRSRVLAHEILAGQLLVETEDHRRVLIPAADVLTVLSRGAVENGG